MTTTANESHAPLESRDAALMLALPPEQFEMLALRVAERIEENRDGGFLDVPGAARYLCMTPGAIRHKIERGQIPHHRVGGRVLFSKSDLRSWVEQGG